MLLALPLAILWLSAVVDAADDAQARYLLHCRGCHLANGTGVPPEVPTLVNEIVLLRRRLDESMSSECRVYLSPRWMTPVSPSS